MNNDMSEVIANFSKMMNNKEMSDNMKNIFNNMNNNEKNTINNNSNNNFSNSNSNNNNSSNTTNNSNNSTNSTDDNTSSNSSNTNNIFGNIDMATLLKIQQIISSMNDNQNDSRTNLLMSLKPYLKDSRKNKVDQYIQLMKMGKIFEIMNPLGGDNKHA